MLHLSSERLAALADEEPTAAEAMHLASCPMCAGERLVHQEMLVNSRSVRDSHDEPLTSWGPLAQRLADQGLLLERSKSAHGISRILRAVGGIAAAFILLAGGAMYGRHAAVSATVAGLEGSIAAGSNMTTVSDEPIVFSSTAEAMQVFLRAQREYQQASAYLAEHEAPDARSSSTVLTRLAALDEMQATSLAALQQAPSDPVINQYYISTLGAREATLKQLGHVIPTGNQVTRY